MPARSTEVINGHAETLDDEIVISGMSGRLPECENFEEYRDKLLGGVDCVSDEERRWENGLHSLPHRMGMIKDLAHFDALFFGIHSKQAHVLDPQTRLLLEATFEAIVDAGINPAELRGSNTGVYIGVSESESCEYWTKEPEKINGYGLPGNCKAMIPNRISFSFDFKGPSLAIDTACSSSLYALAHAVKAIKSGLCDTCIVGGCNLLLKPALSLQFHRLGMLALDGKCKSFDESANGYVRSEGAVIMIIQRAKVANRMYAAIVGAGTNVDGAKEEGITFPSGKMQKKLMEDIYSETGIDPVDIVFVEAHGTGTKVGDPQESNGIAELFCTPNRKEPLLIGSVKSNIGHPEPVSGLASIGKLIFAMETGIIAGNLHYNKPSQNIPALVDGRLKVVDKNTPYTGGLMALNSFGFGGANAHTVLKPIARPKSHRPQTNLSRLITVSGRTEEAVHYFLDKIKEQNYDEELYALVDKIHRERITGHNYRGYAVLDKSNTREVAAVSNEKRPIWYVFSGMGSQWPGMGRALMQWEPFEMSIRRSADTLKKLGVDLMKILTGGENSISNILECFVSIAAVQIALVDVLKMLGIEPDGMVGHSAGEVCCAYADGTVNADQAILLAYARGLAIQESELQEGSMAAVGLTWEECLQQCPPDVIPACHNGLDNVTISGPTKSIDDFVKELEKRDVFAKRVNSFGIAFHSKYIADAAPKLRATIQKIIPNPKRRTSRWVSTSIRESAWNTSLAQYSSADYQANNLLSPVIFYEGTRHIPDNAIVIEIAPHGLLQAILKRSLGENVTNIALMRRDVSDVAYTLASIGKVFNAGGQPNVAAMYPSVSFPVSRGTPMLNSMIKWDHSAEWAVASFRGKKERSGELIVNVDITKEEYQYISGHNIDGRVLFPATGYLTVVWKTFAKLQNQEYEQLSVVFENVNFQRATIMPKDGAVKFVINILEGSGDFEIYEGSSVVVNGKIRLAEEPEKESLNIVYPRTAPNPPGGDIVNLNNQDVYKELRLRGYDYEGVFRGISESDNYGIHGKLKWEQNWVSFMDTMLQFNLIGMDIRELYVPIRMQKVVINPKLQMEMASEQMHVYCDRYIDVIKSGGIEIRGMKANMIARKSHLHASPKVEKYHFVGFENGIPLVEDEEKNKHNVLTIASQLILENSACSSKIKVVEATVDKLSECLNIMKIKRILEDEPMISVDGVVVATTGVDANTMEENSIKLINKNPSDIQFEQNAHLILLNDVIAKQQTTLFDNALASLKLGGFILLEEPKDKLSDNLIKSNNLVVVLSQTTSTRSYYLLRKHVDVATDPVVISITDRNFEWVEPLKNALRESESSNVRIYLVAQAEDLNGLVGLMNCVRLEPGGANVRSIFIQDNNAAKFSLKSNFYIAQLHNDLIHNVLRNGCWGSLRYLPLEQLVDSGKLQVEHAYVDTLTRGDLSSLRWIEGPLRYYKSEMGDMCSIYYAPLNFRDVMLASGKLSVDSLPGDAAKQDCILGFEFTGRNSQGERIMGMVASKAMATTIIPEEGFTWIVPEKWSMEEASTIPGVYCTCYYALIVRGQLQPSESVLIHAGTGGVGLAAIAIALHMGCKVFTTVGSQAKRDFLKKRFPALTDDCIGNSRDTSFEQLILTQTKGRGVDVVLNSLAGELLQASVRCLAVRGRFLEIGKVDLANNTSLGMAVFLKNASVHGILVDALFGKDCADKRDIVRLLNEGMENGAVQPLPVTVFTENQIEQAFRYMASGKHIGKIVIKIRDEEARKIIKPSVKKVTAIPRTYMDPDKVYVLVGGLGGFGLELANWLISRGAKKIVLTSRSGIKTGYQSLCIRRWRDDGITVHISTVDASTEKGAKSLLTKSNKLGPVGGIFNLAVVLRDAMIENQTEADFKTVARAKIDASKYLDSASRSLTPHLDYFVLFSSVACGRGNMGQTNYAFANSVMERLCEARQAAGLPGLAIEWGAVGDVGIVQETMGGNNTEVGGTLPQRIASCLVTFDTFLQQPNPVVSSIVLAEKHRISGDSEVKITDAVANILGIKDMKGMNLNNTLADLGMDSLMGAEIKQTLERNYDMVFSAQEIRALTFSNLMSLESSSTTQDAVNNDMSSNNDEHTLQFDNQLMPSTTLVEMNSKNTTTKLPIFIVHPIEGLVNALNNLANELDAPVYGLQCTSIAPLDSISDLAKFYIKQIKDVQVKGPYTLIGYSFGACVSFEIGVELEKQGEMVKLFFIDGSPNYVATHTGIVKTQKISAGDTTAEQAEALLFFIQQFKQIDQHKLLSELISLKSWDDRVRRTTQIITEATSFNGDEVAKAASSFYYKLVAADKYKPTNQFKGKVVLVKAKDNYVSLGDDYGLTNLCKQRVNIQELKGNHRTILKNPAVVEMANTFYNET